MRKDKNIYFPIVKLKRTRFNVDKSVFETMDIGPNTSRTWVKIFTTPELIDQLQAKAGVPHDHN